MDEKNIESALVEAARVTDDDLENAMRQVRVRGITITNINGDNGDRCFFSVKQYPWLFTDWVLIVKGTDLVLALHSKAQYYTDMHRHLGLTDTVSPSDFGVRLDTHLKREERASLHRKRISSLPKIIEGLIGRSGLQKQASYIESAMKEGAKSRMVREMVRVDMPRPWQREWTSYTRPSYRPIVVKGVKLGRYSVVWESKGTDIIITAKVESSHEALKSVEKTGKLNGGRYRSVEDGRKAVVAAANKLVKELRGSVDVVLKKFEQQEMSKQRWFAAIDKRANTAFRGAKPYKDNNQKRRGYIVYEFRAGGKAIYYIAIGINKIQVDKKGMKGRVYVHLGTYVDNIKKYLKTPSNSDVFEDYFNESETVAEKMVDFRVLADITKAFKAMAGDVKRGIAMAKREGKEATPETAAFLERKFSKVERKKEERERERRYKQEISSIPVYEESSMRGLEWSAVLHDEGYASSVTEGFATAKDAQEYIVSRGGGMADWAVVYGTQLWNKRLGRIEED
jgi:hypothetical protein